LNWREVAVLYKTLLILHMVGLSIGAGTGIYIAAVARHATRNLDQAEARTLIPGVNGAISRVGSIGLALLLLSGIGMAAIVGPAALGTAFWIKMALVVLIVAFVGTMQHLSRRTRRSGDAGAAATMKRLGPVGPVLAVLTVIAAVGAFH
jgi:uncharacterized membrane protein SirB2